MRCGSGSACTGSRFALYACRSAGAQRMRNAQRMDWPDAKRREPTWCEANGRGRTDGRTVEWAGLI